MMDCQLIHGRVPGPGRARRAHRRHLEGPVGRTEAVLYLTAAMTGMLQGELLALRRGDVDWPARRIRVRRTRSPTH